MGEYFGDFDERAIRVARLAKLESKRFGRSLLGTEHFLASIVKEAGSMAARVLGRHGVELACLRQAVGGIAATESSVSDDPDYLPTPRMLKAIHQSKTESAGASISVEHLLLSILADSESGAVGVLKNLEIDLGKLVQDLRKALERASQASLPPSRGKRLTLSEKRKKQKLRQKKLRSRTKGTGMYESLTDRARKILQLANQVAQKFNHEYIGTEHLLLGMLKEGSGVGCNVLANLGADSIELRRSTESLLQSGPEMITMGKLPQTPGVKKVWELAVEEQRRFHHNFLGSEHIILGLLAFEEGVAFDVLSKAGIELPAARTEVMNLLGCADDAPEIQRLAKLNLQDSQEKSNDESKEVQPTFEDRNVIDLKDSLKHFPRHVDLDDEAVLQFWTALNRYQAQHVFLVGEPVDVEEFVDGIAHRLVTDATHQRFDRYGIYALNQNAIGDQLNRVLRNVTNTNRVILSFERFRQTDANGRKQSMDWPLLTRLRDWVGRRSMHFVLSGSEEQFQILHEEWPEMAQRFTAVRLPGYSEAGLEQILNLEVANLQQHHLVTISEEAVAAARSQVAIRSSTAVSNHPWQVVQLLDASASRVSLAAEREQGSPVLQRTQAVMCGLRDLKEQHLAKSDFAAAKRFHDAIVEANACYRNEVPADEIPIIKAEDILPERAP